MRYSERELSLQRGKTTVFDRHEIRLRIRVSSLAIRFRSLVGWIKIRYFSISHAKQFACSMGGFGYGGSNGVTAICHVIGSDQA